ncbi:hypothetical protein ES705_35964 [subsurface metagenome]
MKNSKVIEGFEDYLISSSGKVYSLITNKYLKPRVGYHGYYQVGLYKSGKQYFKFISRLVAGAFIPNPDNKLQAHHIDGNKLNNDVSNLEWVTCSKNLLHAFADGLSKHSPNAGRHKVPVRVYDYHTGQFLSTQPSLGEAARFYGIFYQNIRHVLAGKCNQANGLTFKRI